MSVSTYMISKNKYGTSDGIKKLKYKRKFTSDFSDGSLKSQGCLDIFEYA